MSSKFHQRPWTIASSPRSVSQSIVVKRKLSQSEVDRMVQEAEKSRDEDEVDESKHEAESGYEKFRVKV